MTFLMIACIFAAGIYMVLSAHYIEALFGVLLLSNGANLLLIETNGFDPLPQALILTAIVIGFALIAFLSVFVLHEMKQNKEDEINRKVK